MAARAGKIVTKLTEVPLISSPPDGSVIYKIPKGSTVMCVESTSAKGATFYRMTFNNKTGWVNGGFIQFTDANGTKQSGNEVGNKAAANGNPSIPFNMPASNYKKITSDGKSDAAIEKTLQGYAVKNLTNVFGLPFHFMPNVDPPVDGNWQTYGKMYSSDYLANTPVAIFVPGIPNFLTHTTWGIKNTTIAGKTVKKNVLASLALHKDNELEDDIDFLAGNSDSMDYFSLKATPALYYEYVNSLCSVTANLMGLGDVEYKGKKLGNFDWGTYSKDPTEMSYFKDLIGSDKAVVFAYDPLSGLSDSISNSTTESVLSSTGKSVAAKAREAEFIFGVGAGVGIAYSSDDNIEQLIPELTDMTKNDPSNPFKRIAGLGKTIGAGNNLRFPEIYGDSQFARNYSLDMKFKSPYADSLSKFLYVIVPFWHIFALGAPRMTSATSYSSPFLIRAFSKGAFSIEAGILDGITFKKFGDGEDISEDGIPMEIEITVSFKDLYQSLSMVPLRIGSLSAFFANSGLIDMISSMSGVDMGRFNYEQRMALFLSGGIQDIANTPDRFVNAFRDGLRNSLEGILGK